MMVRLVSTEFMLVDVFALLTQFAQTKQYNVLSFVANVSSFECLLQDLSDEDVLNSRL